MRREIILLLPFIIIIIFITVVIDISESPNYIKSQKYQIQELPNISEGRRIKFRSEDKMPVKILDATLANFNGVFEKFRSEASNHKANLILFLADKDPSTNLSWCPDCVRAEPVIYKKLEASADNVALLRAYVGDRPTWRNPQHPWRVDSRFKLKGVPTLIRWEGDDVQGRLEDHEAHIETKIDALVAF